MILVIDNYDSFTFNLVQALQAAGAEVHVVRNDAIEVGAVAELADDPSAELRGIVISPGPGDPDDAGISVGAVKVAAERGLPLLGVCLGMQSMAAAFGASIVRAPTLVHGEASEVTHDGAGLLEGMPPSFMAARYHSLAIDPATLPPELRVTAMSEVDRVIMGIRHVSLPLEGVQFHPEIRADATGPASARQLPAPGRRGRGVPAGRSDRVVRDIRAGRTGRRGDGHAMSEIVRAALVTIVEGGTLSMDEARAAMGAVMDGEATPAQLAALLMGLRMRGETVDELAGFAAAMRERVTRVEAPEGAIDVVGTGGDGSGTFNISTTAALVAAAAGVPVAKHGNRAMTSRSGSADVLDALGVRIDHDAASAGAALRDRGFAFMFAPNFHPAMKHAGPTRREIGVRTAFNLLGPLTNPAGTRRQLLGVGDAAVAARMAEVVQRLGTDRTFVIHGDGVDELPLDGSGVAYIVAGDVIERHVIDAAALGFKRAATARLSGGTPEENARMTEAVLRGEPGARRDVVLLNAAAALLVGGAVEQMEEGIERAALTIDAGLATELLEALREDRRTAEAAAAADAEGADATTERAPA